MTKSESRRRVRERMLRLRLWDFDRPGVRFFRGLSFFRSDKFTGSTLGLNFGLRRGAEGVSAHREFARQIAVTKNFNSRGTPIGQAGAAQGRFVHPSAFVETIQRLKVHRQIPSRMAGVVKAALGNSPDQG